MTLPTLARTATAAVAALAIAAAVPAPAHAWGKNEQNFLKGVLAAAAVGAIISHNRKANAAPAPQYFAPAPAPVPHYGAPQHYSPVSAAFNEYSPASRRAIQTRLRAYGYYRGGIDGTFGPGTRAAIEAYARDTGNQGALGSRDGTVRLLNGLLV